MTRLWPVSDRRCLHIARVSEPSGFIPAGELGRFVTFDLAIVPQRNGDNIDVTRRLHRLPTG
jgi:hypothetical protein